jgi:hypothetical protein
VWSGSPITVVDSPPGAGKTTLVVNIVAHLTARADLRVLVVTVTRQQATALAHRLVTEIDPKDIEIAVKGLQAGTLPRGLYSASRSAGVKPAKVTVRTLASCALSAPSEYDVIVVDEAYQATYADVSLASAHIDQILLVGDPGQIGPVITVDTSIWRGMKDPPHGRAPEVLVTHEGADSLALDKTWRLGPATATAIAPFYAFPFTSACVARRYVGTGGDIFGEIEAIQVPDADTPDDVATLSVVAERVAALVGGHLFTPGEPDVDGNCPSVSREATEADVAVVLSRNSQVSIVSGLLASKGIEHVTVGTADRLQGGEWPLVVALDPAIGSDESSEHSMSTGRLCVMTSRHTTHLTWVHDDQWKAAVAGRSTAAAQGRSVRTALCKFGVTPPVAPAAQRHI